MNALLKAGRTIASVLAEIARFTGTKLRNLVHALYAATKKVGPIHMLQALHAQMKEGKAAYRVANQMLADQGGKLGAFNREQRAVIAEEHWFNTFGHEVYPDRSRAPNNGRKLDSAPVGAKVQTAIAPARLAAARLTPLRVPRRVPAT